MEQSEGAGPQAAKALVRRYLQRLLNEHDLSACDELLSGAYVDHDAPPGTPPGPQNTRAFVARFLEEYPDMRIEIEDLLAEGDRVAVRAVWRGHHVRSGAVYHQMGIIILRIEGGRLAERWSAYKPLAESST